MIGVTSRRSARMRAELGLFSLRVDDVYRSLTYILCMHRCVRELVIQKGNLLLDSAVSKNRTDVEANGEPFARALSLVLKQRVLYFFFKKNYHGAVIQVEIDRLSILKVVASDLI